MKDESLIIFSILPIIASFLSLNRYIVSSFFLLIKNPHKLRGGAAIPLLFLLSSCGYRWSDSDPIQTISIPYVSGDEDGMLTSELIRTFASETKTEVVSRGGQYRLELAIVDHQNDTIGYRLDPQKIKGKIEKNLVADEARKTISVDLSLFEGAETTTPVFGPHRITASVDYDYVDGDSLPDLQFTDSTGEMVTVLAFSLGQLESVESAQEAATRPLYKKICQKIIDVISSRW